jgi:prophage regulatory protein
MKTPANIPQPLSPAPAVVGERFLRLPEVKARTALSRSTIYEKIGRGKFPRPRQLGARMVAWYQSDIDAWIADPR